MHIIDLTYAEPGTDEELVAYIAGQENCYQQEGVHLASRDGRALGHRTAPADRHDRPWPGSAVAPNRWHRVDSSIIWYGIRISLNTRVIRVASRDLRDLGRRLAMPVIEGAIRPGHQIVVAEPADAVTFIRARLPIGPGGWDGSG